MLDFELESAWEYLEDCILLEATFGINVLEAVTRYTNSKRPYLETAKGQWILYCEGNCMKIMQWIGEEENSEHS